MIHCNEAKMYGLRDILYESQDHTAASMPILCFYILLNFVLFCGWWLQGQKAEARRQGDDWDWRACCEIHEEPIKKFLKKGWP